MQIWAAPHPSPGAHSPPTQQPSPAWPQDRQVPMVQTARRMHCRSPQQGWPIPPHVSQDRVVASQVPAMPLVIRQAPPGATQTWLLTIPLSPVQQPVAHVPASQQACPGWPQRTQT